MVLLDQALCSSSVQCSWKDMYLYNCTLEDTHLKIDLKNSADTV